MAKQNKNSWSVDLQHPLKDITQVNIGMDYLVLRSRLPPRSTEVKTEKQKDKQNKNNRSRRPSTPLKPKLLQPPIPTVQNCRNQPRVAKATRWRGSPRSGPPKQA